MRTTLPLTAIVSEWLMNTDVLPITKASYKTKINLWFRWLSANGRDPRTPTRRDLIDYKHNLEQSAKSTLTVDAYITVVKLFYKYCEAVKYWNHIGNGVKCSVRYSGHRKAALLPEEAAALMHSIGSGTHVDRRDRLMFALMLFLGLRTCEVERIDIRDFDQVRGQNLVRIQRKGRREKAEPLALSDDIMELFENYLAHRDFEPGDPLFVTHLNRGTPQRLSRLSISKIVKERLKSIGINRKDITAHSLRHTCASIMIEQGVPLETVRDMLGHTNTNTTRIYTREANQRVLIRNSPSIIVQTAIKNAQKPAPIPD